MVECGGLHTDFNFDNHFDNGIAYKTRLSPGQQDDFKKTFCAEVAKVVDWFCSVGWLPHPPKPPPPVGSVADVRLFNLPDTDVRVFVSNDYTFSRSLVPAALGMRGRMEFPLYRVVSRQAALAHELVHLYFPNGNRLLAEGFAVHIHQEIGSNPAFPNFGVDLDQAVHAFLRQSGIHLDHVELGALDQMSTPDELILKIGTGWYSSNVTYLFAGSFVKFLIGRYKLEKFRELYLLTPLRPLERNGGEPERWKSVYGESLAVIEQQWKNHLRSVPLPASQIAEELFRTGPQAVGVTDDRHHRG